MVNPIDLEKNTINYLVLDFNKPDELRICLESIRHFTEFDHKIIVCANGGEQDYHWDYYKSGLIDKLILRKDNGGLGLGTLDLFRYSSSEWSLYVQNDQYLGRKFAKEELDRMIYLFDYVPYIKSISLAGNQNNGNFSERAHLINTKFYNSIPGILGWGAGPYHNGEWAEETVNNLYKKNNYKHYIWENPLFIDNGHSAVRQNPDGSLWKHHPDDKKLWLLKGPVKEKFIYPNFTDLEWETVIKDQFWGPGQIPEREKNISFKCWNR